MPTTLVELVDALAGRPERGIALWERRASSQVVHRSYADVARRARRFATWLRARGVKPDDVVFLCLQTSHDLVEAFLGAALLRAIPCCLALPKAIGGLAAFERRLARLAERFPAGHLLTTPEVGAEARRPFFTVPADLDRADEAALEPVDPDALAYVQLTSGSTTTPRAVAISHRNLAANARAIIEGGLGTPDETYVSWLPLYHDMGLVGMVFTALYNGPGLALMSPETFVGAPLRWLEAISRQETSVVTTAPNFGYQWCVDRIAQEKLEALRPDLSRWRLACCGAEMVRPGTLTEFQARFGPFGFPGHAFGPCYGLAEATLAVTMSPPGRPVRVRDGRVSCGPSVRGVELEVRTLDGRPVPPGVEGELVLRGASVFSGYYRDPDETAATFAPDGAFRTGDLGFLHEGELYVTGRVKDLLILDGANVAPYELEWLAQESLPVDGGRAAAFSVERGRREVPVLVVEVREAPPEDTIAALRAAVARDFAPLHDLVLVRRGTLPKTSSGKVQRRTVRELYEAGGLEVLWRAEAKT